jgi:hypothetical protein
LAIKLCNTSGNIVKISSNQHNEDIVADEEVVGLLREVHVASLALVHGNPSMCNAPLACVEQHGINIDFFAQRNTVDSSG